MITTHSSPSAVTSARGVYDFDIHGGTQGDIGLGVNLPTNAIITRSWYRVLTAPTAEGSDTPTIALGIPTDDVAGILAPIEYNNAAFDVDEHDAIQDGSATNFSEKTTANRELTLTIADADLTAGKIELFVDYVVSE
ncbi:MAG: hypothetical protein J7K40_05980 [candidate division Zixibacteria bacterium]|nr:hypothetical protein [candidate division Zixibacteria bacterium]